MSIYSRISSARTSMLGPNSVSSAQNLAIIGRQSVFMVVVVRCLHGSSWQSPENTSKQKIYSQVYILSSAQAGENYFLKFLATFSNVARPPFPSPPLPAPPRFPSFFERETSRRMRATSVNLNYVKFNVKPSNFCKFFNSANYHYAPRAQETRSCMFQ